MTTREEHLQWAKDRAHAELDADPGPAGARNALTSLLSDLNKHPDTAGHAGLALTTVLLFHETLTNHPEVRDHINGFR